ncbi:glycosyltransferase family 2 protein [Venturia nashicola]|uniref:chitin synthase n=1 Tax=Venturia nashicola TaxID=86259 RepID=A0A4Z1PBR7_9PEZI|nr:glycosyltransferase family 2 protein [Venturia nashicola]
MFRHLISRDKLGPGGIAAINEPWPVKDIVYVAVIGTVMLAAMLEWFLWLAAFLYCLWKVFRKANSWVIRVMAIVNAIVFTLLRQDDPRYAVIVLLLMRLRCIFLPIMVVTLPLPAQVTQYFPHGVVVFLQWFAFWSFAGLLTVPWLFCIYQIVTHSIGRKKRIQHVLDEMSAPKVVIVMPCYKEIPEILLRTVDSIVDCEYPPSCLHIFLSFDGDQEDELYLNTIEQLGVPLTLDTYPKSIDVVYRHTRITVSRFPHGGKRHCQKRTFKLIDKVYTEYLKRNDNLFILFIDSDCILDRYCIQNFMYEMELKPGSKHNMLAMTGVITSTTEKNSLITILQDMEYIHGQLFERSVESGCGAVTCLPGALTILRFSAFRKMSKYYFADKAEQCDDLFDYGKCHLGEDRWLTHLFMIGAKERYQIQMNTGAFCKTEAVQDFSTLLKQRRRWFLGFITNEVCMLTDIRLWRRYPILCILRLMQNTIRTTALLFFIMIISLLTTSQRIDQLPVGFIGVSLGLNWLLMLYFGAKLGRYKIWLYPLMFVVNPFFNWIYMVYGIFTAGQRTWGGPRADAGKADEKTSPQEAIEQAEEAGDDLNVVPETFKPAAELQRRRSGRGGKSQLLPVQPSDHLEGRFAPAEKLPGGWYHQTNDSGLTLPDGLPLNPRRPRVPVHPRDSFDSVVTAGSMTTSIYMPRRVESFMPSEDTVTYHINQQGQRPAGGEHYEHERRQQQREAAPLWAEREQGEVENPTKFNFQVSTENLDVPSSAHHNGHRRGKSAVQPFLTSNEFQYSSENSPYSQPAHYSPTSLSGPASGTLAPPQASHRAGDRSSSASQSTVRNSLARQSYLRSFESLPAIEMINQHQNLVPLIPNVPSSARSGRGTPSEPGTLVTEDRSSFVEMPSIEVEDVGEPSMGEAADGYEPRERRNRRRLTKEKRDASSKRSLF